VRVPRVASGSTAESLWLYFGNPDAARADDPAGSYDTAQTLVLHFDRGQAKDASSHAQAIAESGFAPIAQGPIDGAASFPGSGPIRLPTAPSLALRSAAGLTFSAWARSGVPQGEAQLFALRDGAGAVSVSIEGRRLVARAGAAQAQSSTELTPGAWHHVAATLGAGKLTLYVDGARAGEADASVPDIAGETVIGAGFAGELDEVQLASVARSADWIRLAWAGQGPDGRLVRYGEDEQASGGGHSYFGILIGAVTLDGWIVIAILMVMMLVSFAVMIGKARFVARTDHANQSFLEAFQRNPVAMLDLASAQHKAQGREASGRDAKALKDSSLYRLYRLGLRELAHRFELYEQAGQAKVLSPQALGAIKASLDAGMVRESARLNSQMVLLTIAISGGPFLGLLGTVVGVMITFAAIAAVGDVNVNSIAPGIAAALVATVAGLAVAIPALFGYNYLASRIKSLSNDMTVFGDELISRMAERYAP
jgi:biopolymer transport protein ExbB